MKTRNTLYYIFMFCLFTVLFSFPFVVASASGFDAPSQRHAVQVVSYQEDQEDSTFDDLVETGKNLAGVALLLAVLFNAGKVFGVVHDGQVAAFNLIGQTVVFVGLVALKLTGRLDLVPIIDENSAVIANGLMGVLAIIWQLLISRVGHEKVLAGLPLIGKSFSGRKAGDPTIVEFTSDASEYDRD